MSGCPTFLCPFSVKVSKSGLEPIHYHQTSSLRNGTSSLRNGTEWRDPFLYEFTWGPFLLYLIYFFLSSSLFPPPFVFSSSHFSLPFPLHLPSYLSSSLDLRLPSSWSVVCLSEESSSRVYKGIASELSEIKDGRRSRSLTPYLVLSCLTCFDLSWGVLKVVETLLRCPSRRSVPWGQTEYWGSSVMFLRISSVPLDLVPVGISRYYPYNSQ